VIQLEQKFVDEIQQSIKEDPSRTNDVLKYASSNGYKPALTKQKLNEYLTFSPSLSRSDRLKIGAALNGLPLTQSKKSGPSRTASRVVSAPPRSSSFPVSSLHSETQLSAEGPWLCNLNTDVCKVPPMGKQPRVAVDIVAAVKNVENSTVETVSVSPSKANIVGDSGSIALLQSNSSCTYLSPVVRWHPACTPSDSNPNQSSTYLIVSGEEVDQKDKGVSFLSLWKVVIERSTSSECKTAEEEVPITSNGRATSSKGRPRKASEKAKKNDAKETKKTSKKKEAAQPAAIDMSDPSSHASISSLELMYKVYVSSPVIQDVQWCPATETPTGDTLGLVAVQTSLAQVHLLSLPRPDRLSLGKKESLPLHLYVTPKAVIIPPKSVKECCSIAWSTRSATPFVACGSNDGIVWVTDIQRILTPSSSKGSTKADDGTVSVNSWDAKGASKDVNVPALSPGVVFEASRSHSVSALCFIEKQFGHQPLSLITCSENGSIRVWDLHNPFFPHVDVLISPNVGITSVKYIPFRDVVFISLEKGNCALVELKTSSVRPLRSLPSLSTVLLPDVSAWSAHTSVSPAGVTSFVGFDNGLVVEFDICADHIHRVFDSKKMGSKPSSFSHIVASHAPSQAKASRATHRVTTSIYDIDEGSQLDKRLKEVEVSSPKACIVGGQYAVHSVHSCVPESGGPSLVASSLSSGLISISLLHG